ncbi:MAG: PAS domain S-box protein, partial [Pseudomonadota bacterium]|nr:PAS domain S-box protein [Pseudomonadota bacterium]
MDKSDIDEELLRSVALQNASSILRARVKAEQELVVAKEALRASEELLRATFEQAAVGIVIIGLDGKFVEMNRKFCEIFGYTEEELRAFTFRDITDPADIARTADLVHNLLGGRIDHYAIDKRYRRRDGSTIWGRATVTLLRNAAGDTTRMIGVIEDISKGKEAELALHEETRVLELLNRTGTTLAANLDLEELLQSITDSATQLAGAQFGAFFHTGIGEDGEAFMLYTLSGAPREAFEKFGHPRATPI